MRTMQLAMRARSRRERAGTADALCAAPGEGSVLAMVLSAGVTPAHPQGVHVALRGMSEGKPARGGMARVLEVDRLVVGGVESQGDFGAHVDETPCSDRPPGTRAIEPDRRRGHAQKLPNQRGKGCHGSARRPARDRADGGVLLLI